MHLTISGRVEKGEGMAKEMGCPTANIAVEQGVLIPGLGVYVGSTELEGRQYPSLVCINDGRTGYNLKMEVHLLDQDIDLTNKRLKVTLFQKLRGLVPYQSTEQMSKMIQGDLKDARAWFKQHVQKSSQGEE